MKAISNASLRSFSEIYDDYIKLASNRYSQGFNKEYALWQENNN